MISEDVYSRFLNALLKGDRPVCTQTVEELLSNNIEVKPLYLDLFQRALYEVGSLWEKNKISVTIEHIATAIVERLLAMVYPELISRKIKLDNGGVGDKTFMMSCVVNEFHQVGARMVTDIFEIHGWESYYAGANTPIADLVRTTAQIKPDCLGLSMSIYSNLRDLIDTIQSLRASFPSLTVLVGGQAFNWGDAGVIKKFPNVLYIPTVDLLEEFLTTADA